MRKVYFRATEIVNCHDTNFVVNAGGRNRGDNLEYRKRQQSWELSCLILIIALQVEVREVDVDVRLRISLEVLSDKPSLLG